MPEKNKKNTTGITPLRTFKTDTSAYIKRKGVSLLDIAAAEAKKKPFSGYVRGKKGGWSGTQKIILFFSVLLLVAGASAGVLFFKQRESARAPSVVLPRPPIVPDEEAEIAISGIYGILDEVVPPRKLFYFPIVRGSGVSKRLVSVREFFAETGITSPAGLASSLEDGFMPAVFRLSEKSPILIFKVRSYENAFASMLKWEKSIVYDLAPIFNIKTAENLKTSFYDKEIQNRDSRVLEDEDGSPVLLYSFINRKYLVITTREEALKEIFRRFTVSRYLNK